MGLPANPKLPPRETRHLAASLYKVESSQNSETGIGKPWQALLLGIEAYQSLAAERQRISVLSQARTQCMRDRHQKCSQITVQQTGFQTLAVPEPIGLLFVPLKSQFSNP